MSSRYIAHIEEFEMIFEAKRGPNNEGRPMFKAALKTYVTTETRKELDAYLRELRLGTAEGLRGLICEGLDRWRSAQARDGEIEAAVEIGHD